MMVANFGRNDGSDVTGNVADRHKKTAKYKLHDLHLAAIFTNIVVWC
jgi:hypothetical protein